MTFCQVSDDDEEKGKQRRSELSEWHSSLNPDNLAIKFFSGPPTISGPTVTSFVTIYGATVAVTQTSVKNCIGLL